MHCLFLCVIDTVHELFGHSTLSIEFLIKKIRNARASLGYFLDVFIHNSIHSYKGFTVIKTLTFRVNLARSGNVKRVTLYTLYVYRDFASTRYV